MPYAVAGLAARQVHDRARVAKLSRREWQILSAVVDHTATYSKLRDETYAAAIAAEARIVGKDAVKFTRQTLRKLHRLGIIIWTPGRGSGKRSVVELPPPRKGAQSAPLSRPEREVDHTRERGPDRPSLPSRTEKGEGDSPEGSLLPPDEQDADGADGGHPLDFLEHLLVGAEASSLERTDGGACDDCTAPTERRYRIGSFSVCWRCARSRTSARGGP